MSHGRRAGPAGNGRSSHWPPEPRVPCSRWAARLRASSCPRPRSSKVNFGRRSTTRKWPRPTWWDDRQGRPILATDFQEWQGASGVWRGLFVNERWVPGTGLAVLVIRVKYDATEFQVSTDLVPPRGFSFYHDDPRQRIR